MYSFASICTSLTYDWKKNSFRKPNQKEKLDRAIESPPTPPPSPTGMHETEKMPLQALLFRHQQCFEIFCRLDLITPAQSVPFQSLFSYLHCSESAVIFHGNITPSHICHSFVYVMFLLFLFHINKKRNFDFISYLAKWFLCFWANQYHDMDFTLALKSLYIILILFICIKSNTNMINTQW